MAQRPIFVPIFEDDKFVKAISVNFKWHAGYSITQKQKSIKSLHENAKIKNITPILEISTKSTQKLGNKLSAFNLNIELDGGKKISVESAYQGSKIFEHGGPYVEFFNMSGKDIKNSKKLHNSGKLIGFEFNGIKWDLEPKNAFYNWLYINALYQNIQLGNKLKEYNGFSDIEFNPKKSFNCQARAAALFVSLIDKGLLEKTILNKKTFLQIIYNCNIPKLDIYNHTDVPTLNKLYSDLNKWRYRHTNYAIEDSLSTAKEFVKKYPMYSQMMPNVLETIKKANQKGWFDYDSTFNDVDAT